MVRIRTKTDVIKIHYDVDLMFYDFIVFELAPFIHTFITAAEKYRTIRHKSRVRVDTDTTEYSRMENHETECKTCRLRYFKVVGLGPSGRERSY